LIAILAQAAQDAEGVSYGLLISVIAVEATLSGLAWTAFNAEARSQKDRDSDIRDAQAGYDSGLVIPAVAHLIEAVLQVRRSDDEPIQTALDRADTSRDLREVVTAATAASSPRQIEERLIRAWTFVGGATISVQLCGPVLLLNHIADKDLTSNTIQTIAGVGLSGGVAVLVVAMVVVRQLARSLTRAIRAGKDAASGA
jgi:hypothetical protein